MKQRKPMPDMYLPKAEREQKQEITLVFSPCCECGKAIGEGYYGRWGNGAFAPNPAKKNTLLDLMIMAKIL